MPRGFFITLEGGEGAGKTTMVAALIAELQARGIKVVQLRDPGGTPVSAALRKIFVSGEGDSLLPQTELNIAFGGRWDLWKRGVEPALQDGAVVICDRWWDSTYVYQGDARGLGAEKVKLMHWATMGNEGAPDLTLLLDVPVEVGFAREQGSAKGEGRFESLGTEFHEKVRAGFLARAAAEPDRIKIIDATRPKDEVLTAAMQLVLPHIQHLKAA